MSIENYELTFHNDLMLRVCVSEWVCATDHCSITSYTESPSYKSFNGMESEKDVALYFWHKHVIEIKINKN